MVQVEDEMRSAATTPTRSRCSHAHVGEALTIAHPDTRRRRRDLTFAATTISIYPFVPFVLH